MMSDTCAWPDCHSEYTIMYRTGKKPIGLCDRHNKVVAHDRKSVKARAREIVGLPMPVALGRMLRGQVEKNSRCCVLECGAPATLVVSDGANDERPLCHSHLASHHNSTVGLAFEKEAWQPFVSKCGTMAVRNSADNKTDYGDLFDTDLYFD